MDIETCRVHIAHRLQLQSALEPLATPACMPEYALISEEKAFAAACDIAAICIVNRLQFTLDLYPDDICLGAMA